MSMIIEMLRVHEGVETHAYKCTADKTTIGVGRNIDPSGGIGLSSDEIDYLLSNDVKRVSAELIRAFSWYSELDEVRKDAMIDMCFNMGLPRLKLFKKSLAAMANGDYDIAAIEFLDSNWAKQVGGRSIIVTDMIRSGDYR
jgi:lysozyme|tara:strand:- start:1373 stop:1795 length:423 start_codon:yes stop_codon:yes gene_type:complete